MKITNLQLTLINYSLLKYAKANFKDFHSTIDSLLLLLFFCFFLLFLYTRLKKIMKRKAIIVQQNNFIFIFMTHLHWRRLFTQTHANHATKNIKKLSIREQSTNSLKINSKDLVKNKKISTFRCLYQNLTRLIRFTTKRNNFFSLSRNFLYKKLNFFEAKKLFYDEINKNKRDFDHRPSPLEAQRGSNFIRRKKIWNLHLDL